MRSRKIISLGILVVGIWGAVILQIYNGLSTETVPALRSPVRKTVYHKAMRSDYPLTLNYRDPFFAKKKRKPKAVVKGAVTRKTIAPPVISRNIVIHWNKVQYMGSIYNVSKDVTMASLRINGTDYIGKKGDIVGGFTIADVLPDSVQLTFGTQEKYIVKNK